MGESFHCLSGGLFCRDYLDDLPYLPHPQRPHLFA
jgi:hypothetical protein